MVKIIKGSVEATLDAFVTKAMTYVHGNKAKLEETVISPEMVYGFYDKGLTAGLREAELMDWNHVAIMYGSKSSEYTLNIYNIAEAPINRLSMELRIQEHPGTLVYSLDEVGNYKKTPFPEALKTAEVKEREIHFTYANKQV
ncbi:MAG: hypothetical protein AABW92_05400 [Nanoarchaeota archaeon]